MAGQYWESRYKLFEKEEKDEGVVNVKEATKNFATAWSIFAALLMTVSFSLIPVDTGSFYSDNDEDINRNISYIYVGLLFISTCFSFLAVLVGTLRYTFFDGVPAAMIYKAIEAISLPGAQAFVYPAMCSQMLASAVGCYLFLGTGMLILAFVIFFFIFAPGFVFVLWRYKKSIHGVDGLQMGVAVELGQKKVVDKDEDEEKKDAEKKEENEENSDFVAVNGIVEQNEVVAEDGVDDEKEVVTTQ